MMINKKIQRGMPNRGGKLFDPLQHYIDMEFARTQLTDGGKIVV